VFQSETLRFAAIPRALPLCVQLVTTSLRHLIGDGFVSIVSDLLSYPKRFVRFESEIFFGLWNRWGNPCANCACRGVSASVPPFVFRSPLRSGKTAAEGQEQLKKRSMEGEACRGLRGLRPQLVSGLRGNNAKQKTRQTEYNQSQNKSQGKNRREKILEPK